MTSVNLSTFPFSNGGISFSRIETLRDLIDLHATELITIWLDKLGKDSTWQQNNILPSIAFYTQQIQVSKTNQAEMGSSSIPSETLVKLVYFCLLVLACPKTCG